MNALLAIDIGNSTTGLCLFPNFNNGNIFHTAQLTFAADCGVSFYKKTLSSFIKQYVTEDIKISGIAISSVIPAITGVITDAVKSVCNMKPLIISHRISADMSFDVRSPEKVGADRIANAIAAWQHTKTNTIVADLGTATTLSVIDRQKNFLGGAILPGLSTMASSLGVHTAQLPNVNIKAVECALGKDTSSAILSGILFGTAGAIEKIVKNIEKEQGFKVKLILTGGNAEMVSPLIQRRHKYIANLIFEGLRIIYLQSLADRGKNI
jgi:type III pantothenate kinase